MGLYKHTIALVVTNVLLLGTAGCAFWFGQNELGLVAAPRTVLCATFVNFPLTYFSRVLT